MELEKKLVALRKEKKISQLKLAEIMGVSRQAISRWEVGVATPSTENLKRLSTLYGVSLEYLLNDDITEMSHEELNIFKEQERSTIKKRKKGIVLIFLLTGILTAFICVMFWLHRDEKPISMDNMEGSEMETKSDFELEW